jgi:hypothetical protein
VRPPTIHLAPIVSKESIPVSKERIIHSGVGHHTSTPAGTYWNNEDMATLQMIWNNGIKKGEDPVVDSFIARMVG